MVEIDAEKGIKDNIEIMYKSKNVDEGTTCLDTMYQFSLQSFWSYR